MCDQKSSFFNAKSTAILLSRRRAPIDGTFPRAGTHTIALNRYTHIANGGGGGWEITKWGVGWWVACRASPAERRTTASLFQTGGKNRRGSRTTGVALLQRSPWRSTNAGPVTKKDTRQPALESQQRIRVRKNTKGEMNIQFVSLSLDFTRKLCVCCVCVCGPRCTLHHRIDVSCFHLK